MNRTAGLMWLSGFGMGSGLMCLLYEWKAKRESRRANPPEGAGLGVSEVGQVVSPDDVREVYDAIDDHPYPPKVEAARAAMGRILDTQVSP